MRGDKFIFLIVIVILIFFSGCKGGKEIGQRIGGIEAKFVKEMPPLNGIRDGNGFSVGLIFTNYLLNGENVKLCIYDTPPDSMGGIQGNECTEFFIDAALRDDNGKITPAKSEVIKFPIEGDEYVYHGIERGTEETKIIAEYEYQVDARFKVGKVCMKKKPYIETDYKCEAEEVFSGSDIEGDIAPVIVDKIEKDIIPVGGNDNRVILDIYLKKAPIGYAMLEGENKNMLRMDVSLGGTEGIFVCEGRNNGMIEMRDQTKKIRCEAVVNLGGQDYYTDSINIELNYLYKVVKNDLSPIKLLRSREGLS